MGVTISAFWEDGDFGALLTTAHLLAYLRIDRHLAVAHVARLATGLLGSALTGWALPPTEQLLRISCAHRYRIPF
jgi:hypothetical protein